MSELKEAGRSPSPTTATAPAAAAWGAKLRPSAFVPDTATKAKPGSTRRLSEASPATGRVADGPPAASGKSPARVWRPALIASPRPRGGS
jgi:hypothetical protein